MNPFPAPNPVKQHCLVFGPWLLHRPPAIFLTPICNRHLCLSCHILCTGLLIPRREQFTHQGLLMEKNPCCSRCLQSDAMREGKGVLRWRQNQAGRSLYLNNGICCCCFVDVIFISITYRIILVRIILYKTAHRPRTTPYTSPSVSCLCRTSAGPAEGGGGADFSYRAAAVWHLWPRWDRPPWGFSRWLCSGPEPPSPLRSGYIPWLENTAW